MTLTHDAASSNVGAKSALQARLAQRQPRGELTVFLGMAPGVGKTHAMLERARALKAKGADVVIGLIETHGREDTTALANGLETLARIGGAGTHGQFDLDAALSRHPHVLIVDDLAHANPAGSRHATRHQDIAKLLGAGINVWTAVNIGNLDSLSELVARMTDIRVRDTVPDSVLDGADEIVLVDVPPATLMDRYQAGAIHHADSPGRSLDGYFQPTTLASLRALSLRRAADRPAGQDTDIVDAEPVGPASASVDRLLICVGPDGMADRVVREGSHLAAGLNARWVVLSLSARHGLLPDPGDGDQLEEALHLAERLGAQVLRDTSTNHVAAILACARREGATQIVIGRAPGHGFWHPALADTVLQSAGNVGVHVIPFAAPQPSRSAPQSPHWPEWLLPLGLPVLAVGATTLLGLSLPTVVALQNLAMLLLATVLLCAVIAGRLSALVAAVLSVASYNFFFMPPSFHLTTSQPGALLSLAIFVAVAVVAGLLAARQRLMTERLRRQAGQSQVLLDFARKMSGAFGYEQVVETIASHLQGTLRRPCVVLTFDQTGELELASAWPADQHLDASAMSAARWAADSRETTGYLTPTLPQVPYLFQPIQSGQMVLGVAGLAMRPGQGPVPEDVARTYTALLEQSAIALDRARLTRDITNASLAREGHKVQGTLLSTLSHDLRIPLDTIAVAVVSLRERGEGMSPAGRTAVLASIEEELGHLNGFVANLFEMGRIEAGIPTPRLTPVDIAEVIDDAVAAAIQLRPDLNVQVSLQADLPDAMAEHGRLERVLFNLLDNAGKYGGGMPVAIYARAEGAEIAITVTDRGAGIPADDLDRVFEKFYSRDDGDGQRPGHGLGLAIARGLVTAMGGTITVESPAFRHHGTRFVVRLPHVAALHAEDATTDAPPAQ